MSGTTDTLDYDNFDYKLYDQDPMQLEQALKKATDLNKEDPKSFHRIVPANEEKTTFKIETVSVEEVQSNLWNKWSAALMRRRMISRLFKNG